MRAAIDEHAHGPVAVTGHDHRLAPHPRREKVARISHLALVAENQPRAAEEPVELQLEQCGVGVHRAMDTVGLHELLDGLHVHGSVL
jgi:hypothetical protein